jgi:Dehydrogenases with different specificities (related to short-chain alcohol dehydrogenases)
MSTQPEVAAAPVVLITGAARRIGAVIAERLHADGWRVVIHCRRSREAAEALAARLCARRPDSAAVESADLGDPAAIAPLAEAAARRWGRLDALVNNASGYYATPLADLRAQQIDDLLASNLRAPLLLAQACLPRLADGGVIVNVLDALTPRARPGFVAYHAAKAGLWAATLSMAAELAPRLRVNGVAPGHTLWNDSDPLSAAEQQRELARVPMGRLARPREIAAAVAWLVSAEAVYVTGQILAVDGGLQSV